MDAIVRSKYYRSCEFWKNKEGTADYKEWAQSNANECQINHEGSSDEMNVDAIVEMFSRSEELYNVKYSNYIGDGDSKTFKSVVGSQLFKDFTRCKKECINHVQKRMGMRLRDLKISTRGLGGKGKLTSSLIDELTIYYSLAIRRNHDSVEKMRDAIWATLCHKISTDKKPQHENCPEDADSWCS